MLQPIKLANLKNRSVVNARHGDFNHKKGETTCRNARKNPPALTKTRRLTSKPPRGRKRGKKSHVCAEAPFTKTLMSACKETADEQADSMSKTTKQKMVKAKRTSTGALGLNCNPLRCGILQKQEKGRERWDPHVCFKTIQHCKKEGGGGKNCGNQTTKDWKLIRARGH